jgi:exodeoxyribonuclease V alpha subunit
VDEPADLDAGALTAEVTAVRFSVPDGDFAVLGAVTDDGDEITLTGALGHLHAGEAVDVEGAWRRHARHGWQFHAERVRVRPPVGDQALLAYLGAVKHVGIRGAAWLLERHGPEVLGVVDRDPQGRLREVPGIGPAKIRAAVASWEDQGALRAVRLFLEEHGVPATVAARIYRHFGAGSIATLQADPYALTELDGIGFATADALARALGTPPDSPGRLDAGIVHALHQAEDDGHCSLPRTEMLARARRLLDADPEPRLDALAARGRVVLEDGRVAEAGLHATERRLAGRVRELLDDEPVLRIRDPERPDGPRAPTDAQWAVVANVLDHRLSILTGLPGTGKTQSMRALVDLLHACRRTVRLCAPTGKAARRLGETTGAEATTIHRLLEFVPGEGFARGPDDPIPGTDVLIVDEASMLGLRLAAALIDAVGPRTHVLLVGDVDQLAPVGPGRVLEDLIESGVVPTVRLTEIFRQAARSMIVRAAHAINAGQPPPTRPREGDLHDFFLIGRDGPQAIFDEVCALAAERLPAHFGLGAVGDVQVLAPMHRGPLGIDAFNAELRGRLNPEGASVPGTAFRIGDRVIQTKNSYEHELMNGELGMLVAHDPERETVLFAADDGRRLRLPVADTRTLKLAYAISVHKAQGSQMPIAVVPLFRGHQLMLTRNLIYTAVTRSEQVTVLVGEPGALQLALGRRDAHARHTQLAELVAA